MVTVCTLLVLGAILIVVDIVFIPGMIVGIAGAVFMATGVLTAYSSLGTQAGHLSLAASTVIVSALLFYMFRTDIWSKFALNDTISDKVNDHLNNLPALGTIGQALSDLRPGGKASFGDSVLEVTTRGSYCKAGSDIRVIHMENRKIIVEPIEDADSQTRGKSASQHVLKSK